MVFESMHKWDGREETVLSVSQVKQIAGRAGRYGLHGDDTGGIVTTLYHEDLPLLHELMSATIPSTSRRATIPIRIESHTAIEELLPVSSFATVFDILTNVSEIGSDYMTQDHGSGAIAASTIDAVCKDMTLSERMLVFHAPIPWRDTTVVEVALVMLRKLRETDLIEFLHTVSTSPEAVIALEALTVRERGGNVSSKAAQKYLKGLESMYRITVLYLWFSFRFPLAFADRATASTLR